MVLNFDQTLPGQIGDCYAEFEVNKRVVDAKIVGEEA
jgi:hypothetical protein